MAETKKKPPVTAAAAVSCTQHALYSDYLQRDVVFDVYLTHPAPPNDNTSLLLVNDGQDLVTMHFEGILRDVYQQHAMYPLMVVGIHCGPDRLHEYGTICQPDYKGCGSKAGIYNRFIFDELLPCIRRRWQVASFKEKAFAGFSLGGLSALDIVWNQPNQFSRVGVFSGSLWWRRKAYEDGYNDEVDRIMHLQVCKGSFHPWLKFYLEAGALDETADRNQNGIIDSIDDTLDLVVALKTKGYTNDHIVYCELPDGRHDVPTWARAFPDFLKWGWQRT